MKSAAPADWTLAWRGSTALALSAWTREPRLLADPVSARLLELSLELQALGRSLVLHGFVVLPGALHVVGGRPQSSDPTARGAWPAVFGQVRALHARWDNRRRSRTGSLWREGSRIRPLREGEIAAAVARCHAAPVAAGLVRSPGEWPFSSWSRRGGADPAGLLRPR